MTENQIEETRKISKKIIENFFEIEKNKNSSEKYIEALREKSEADYANRKLFLKYNKELTGYSLEFRNIYGIEGGVYYEKPIVREFDPPDLLESEKYDSELIIEAAQLNPNTPFFVDERKADEFSPYYVPYCPPNLDAWYGGRLPPYKSKRFYKTEKNIINAIDDLISGTGSLNWQNIDEYFDSENQVEFYSTQEGEIVRDIPKFTVNYNNLVAPGGGMYTYSESTYLNPSSSIYYTVVGTAPTEGDLVAFKLLETPSSGILSLNIGYAIAAEVSGNDVLFDLIYYDGPFKTNTTYYDRRKLWKFWEKTRIANKHPFTMQISRTFPAETSFISNLLNAYKISYIDNILYFLDKIERPPQETKVSIEKLKTVQDAFADYENSLITLTQLINIIKERRDWLYSVPGSASPRAQEIHDYLRKSDIFEKVYGTLNSRINKRTGTLRELEKYIYNTNEARKTQELKEESITAYGDTLVVYRLLENTNGSNKIQINLELDTIQDFYTKVKWMNEIIILSDDETMPFFTARITEIKERGENALALTLSENVPEGYNTDDNARLVKVF